MTRAVGLVLGLIVASSGCRTTGGKLGGSLAGAGVIFGTITTTVCAGDDIDGEPDCSSSQKDVLGALALGAIVGGVTIAIISEARYKPPAMNEPAPAPTAAR
jgi:hypothetical protein